MTLASSFVFELVKDYFISIFQPDLRGLYSVLYNQSIFNNFIYIKKLDSSFEMEFDDGHGTSNVVNSEFTINSFLASFKHLVVKRHEFLRSVCILLSVLRQHSDRVFIIII